MIGSTNASASLSGIYNNINTKLSSSLSKIASGKRAYNPSDDFTSYIKATAISSEQLAVQRNKETIAAAREVTGAGIKFGQKVMEQMSKLKELATSYAATTDTSAQAAIKAQGDGIVTALNTFIAGAKAGSSNLNAVSVTGAGLNMTGSLAAVVADVSATTAADAGIAAASTYMATMQASDDAYAAMAEVNDSVDNAKINTLSAIEDINDVTELAKVTDLQVRSQAAVSMMAQANSTRAGIARLFM